MDDVRNKVIFCDVISRLSFKLILSHTVSMLERSDMLSKLHEHNGIIVTLLTRKARYLCVMPIQRYDLLRYSSYRGGSLINNLWGISTIWLIEISQSAMRTLEDNSGCLSCSTKL